MSCASIPAASKHTGNNRWHPLDRWTLYFGLRVGAGFVPVVFARRERWVVLDPVHDYFPRTSALTTAKVPQWHWPGERQAAVLVPRDRIRRIRGCRGYDEQDNLVTSDTSTRFSTRAGGFLRS
jgi:hypothetical protein